MIVTYELTDLRQFNAWSGAVQTMQRAYEIGKVDYLNEIVNEIFCEGCTETELNDWLWFDADQYLEEE